jgi:hypothetical protein
MEADVHSKWNFGRFLPPKNCGQHVARNNICQHISRKYVMNTICQRINIEFILLRSVIIIYIGSVYQYGDELVYS